MNSMVLGSSFSIELCDAIPGLRVPHPQTLGQSLNLYVQVAALKMEDVNTDLKIQGGITY